MERAPSVLEVPSSLLPCSPRGVSGSSLLYCPMASSPGELGPF